MLFNDNPFFILDLPCNATRRQISQKAEELSFFEDSQQYQKAQTDLANPSKRLQAELSWVDMSEEERETLIDAIKNKSCLDYSKYSSYTKLNLSVYCFGTLKETTVASLVDSVKEINDAYISLNPEEITNRINTMHASAGIQSVTADEVSAVLQESRFTIKKCIQAKADLLSEKDYIVFASQLANQVRPGSDNCILDDAVDEYAIRLQAKIDAGLEEIKERIDGIVSGKALSYLQTEVNEVVDLINNWGVLVKPMQITSDAKGLTEPNSKNLTQEVQKLIKYLNDSQETELAIKTANELQKELSKQNELSELFGEISKTLSNNLAAEPLAKDLANLKRLVDSAKTRATSNDIQAIGNTLYKLDRSIKNSPFDNEEKQKLRHIVFLMTRGFSVELYNRNQVALSCQIFYVINRIFGADPQMQMIIIRDRLTIEQNPAAARELATLSPYDYSESPESIENRQQSSASPTVSRSVAPVSSSSHSDLDERNSFIKILIAIIIVFGFFMLIANSTSSTSVSTTVAATKATVQTPPATTPAATTAASVEVTTEAPHGQYYRVTAEALNVRDSKNRDQVVATLSKGDIIEEVGSYADSDWVLFKMGGRKVVAYRSYLEKVYQNPKKSLSNNEKKDYKQYYSASTTGSKVYVRVKSIVPWVGISNSKNGANVDVVCKCKNADNSEFWLYIPISDYRKYIDPTAKLTDSNNASAADIAYTLYPTIYGTVKEADSLCFGLSSSINSNKILYFSSFEK